MSFENPSRPHIKSQTVDWVIDRRGRMEYLIYLPADYHQSNQTRWPLLLYLHGSGERGTDCDRISNHGPLRRVKEGVQFPFIIVAPLCPPAEIWENEPLLQLLDFIETTYAVDNRRIYLTGMSMGGYGAWKLGLTHPERFAALAPICGGANLIDVVLHTRDKDKDLTKLPIWAFHGAKDEVVPLVESERVVDALKFLGVKQVRFTVYPDAKHDSWTETYSCPEFYEWLLSHSR